MLLGALCALGSSFTWAFGVSVYSQLGLQYPPSVVNTTRAVVAFVIFIFWLALNAVWGELPPLPNGTQTLWLFLSMISSYAVGDFLFLLAAMRVGVPSALAIASIYPVFSSAMGWFFRGETMRPLGLVGLLLVILGTIWIILAGQRQATEKKGYQVGVLLALLTSLFWALNTYSVARGSEGLSPQASNSVRMLAAMILCPLMGGIMGAYKKGFRWILPGTEIKKHAWVFALEACGGSVFYVLGLTLAPLGVASALSGLSPVVAAPIAWVRRTEPVSPQKFLALLLVVLGVVLLTAV